jgi:hypothetical protein
MNATALNPEAVAALRLCLSHGASADAAARAAGRAGWDAVLATAATLRLGPALVAQLRAKGAVPAIPALVLASGRRTITAALDEIWTAHVEQRAGLTARLVELVAALNAEGLEPLLMKGARSLASGTPAWRTMRDLDLLLTGSDAARAHAIALSLGYRTAPGAAERSGKHHFQPLFRDDLPGWLEIHRRAAVFRAEALLPTSLLETMAEHVDLGGASARTLRRPAHLLHALVHHHVGHRGDKGGGIDLKGLFEFTADVAVLTAAARDETLALASRHPRTLAALELWVAAAHAAFAMPVVAPFAIYADAAARAARALDRIANPGGRYAGVLEEIGFANASQRLRRLPGGGSPVARQVLRLRTVGSMLRPMIAPAGD